MSYDAHAHEALAASPISMFDPAFGVVWESERELTTVQESLLWVDVLEFDVSDAIEAARIQAELQADGRRIPIGDLLIAGVARNRGATLVASDDHFEHVADLDVENHRELGDSA